MNYMQKRHKHSASRWETQFHKITDGCFTYSRRKSMNARRLSLKYIINVSVFRDYSIGFELTHTRTRRMCMSHIRGATNSI